MDHLFLIANWADFLGQAALMIMASLAAKRWGGPATRIAAVVNLLAFVTSAPAGMLLTGDGTRMWVICSLDLLAAAGFLYAAAWYNNPWIGVAVLAQGIQAGIDVIYIGQGSSFDRMHHFVFGAVENVFTWAIQASILGAALADRRRLALQVPVRV